MLEERIKYIKSFLGYLFKGYASNRSPSVAAELTVTSLLAMVPMTTVVFGLLVFIPGFEQTLEKLQANFFEYFVPATGSTIRQYINEFVAKANDLSVWGVIALFITALMMMRTIDTSFNKIWQSSAKKSIAKTFLIYWAVLTLGPILLGVGLLLSAYFSSLSLISDLGQYAKNFTIVLPFVLALTAFSLVFFVVPNRSIKPLHALFAGLLTAMLFELAKWLFAIFVSRFSTYQLIFGAISVMPLFLIWVYLSWAIVLLGAQFCYSLESFKLQQTRKRQEPLVELMKWLVLLAEKQSQGEKLTDQEINELQDRRNLYGMWLDKLVEGGLVSRDENDNYCLVGTQGTIEYAKILQLSGSRLPSLEEIKRADLPDKNKQKLLQIFQEMQKLLKEPLS